VKFHLTYQGELKHNSAAGADHVQEIRKQFHPQLCKLWNSHPLLLQWPHPQLNSQHHPQRMRDFLAHEFERLGYHFVPLAMTRYNALVSLEILFLRAGVPGTILRSADLDGRLKTLLDGLRMPTQKQEFGSYDKPAEGEDPFYCLMEDDKLVSNLSIKTDALLQPTAADGRLHTHDARVVIGVHVGTYVPAVWSMPFT
jgi:hypothetical protein